MRIVNQLFLGPSKPEIVNAKVTYFYKEFVDGTKAASLGVALVLHQLPKELTLFKFHLKKLSPTKIKRSRPYSFYGATFFLLSHVRTLLEMERHRTWVDASTWDDKKQFFEYALFRLSEREASRIVGKTSTRGTEAEALRRGDKTSTRQRQHQQKQ